MGIVLIIHLHTFVSKSQSPRAPTALRSISQTWASSPTGKPALACPGLPTGTEASPPPHGSSPPQHESATKLPPPTQESPAKLSRRKMSKNKRNNMVRKRVSNSKHNSLDHDELRDELQRRGTPMGKARTRLQMLHQLSGPA